MRNASTLSSDRLAATARDAVEAIRNCQADGAVTLRNRAGARSRGLGSAEYERGVADTLRAVAEAALALRQPCPPAFGGLEPESLAARLLVAIDARSVGNNRTLAEQLDTGQTQLSRAGARLRDLDLARRRRHGRENEWLVTADGHAVAAELREVQRAGMG